MFEVSSTVGQAATEEAKQTAIDNGLAYLAGTQAGDGSWYLNNNGTVAATASAALAFIEEGYTPGDGSAYDGVVTKAVNYVFNQATADGPGGMYFNPGNYDRSIYTTGIVAPMVYALGQAKGPGTVVGAGSGAINTGTYTDAMQKIMNWYTWGQNDTGWAEGGWGYHPNSGTSDNSTAQWGTLPFLYGNSWGLTTPQSVKDGLETWTNYVQNPVNGDWMDGGSGYNNNSSYVNMSKTGGMLLEFGVIGKGIGDGDVQAALAFMNQPGIWNAGPSGTWYGNLNHPYAMWAAYKGLQYYGLMETNTDGILLGNGMPGAPGGFTIGFDGGPQYPSAGEDWYSQYCDVLVNAQNGACS